MLSVSVKRVKLIQEKKKCRAWHFPLPVSHTAVVDLVHSQVLNVRTKEADGEVLTYKCKRGGMPDKALITACHDKHACQQALTEGAQRNARDWISGAFDWHDPCSRAGLGRSVAGLWFLCRSSSLSVFVYTKGFKSKQKKAGVWDCAPASPSSPSSSPHMCQLVTVSFQGRV